MNTLATPKPAPAAAPATSPLAEVRQEWPILVTAMLGITALMVPVHVAGVYMPIWQEAFGWSRAEMGTALSVYIAVTSLLAPAIGALVDRKGARPVALLSMVLLAFGYGAFFMLQTSIWSLYFAYGLVALLGAGTTQVTFCRPIVQSFDSARGLALALAQSGSAISLLVAPILAYTLLQFTGWRESWLGLALVPVVMLPLVFFGLRDKAPAQPAASARPLPAAGMEFDQALRSGKLWLFVTSFCLFYFGTAATVGQLVPILGGMGLSTEEAIAAQSLMGIAVMIGRLGTGYLLDRIFASYIYFAMGALAAIGFMVLTLGISGLIWIAVPCIGLAVGAEVDIAGYMISRYFGQRHFGKLFGVAFAMLCAGGILAHPFYGFIFDVTSSYAMATATSMVVVFAASCMLLRQEPYPDFD